MKKNRLQSEESRFEDLSTVHSDSTEKVDQEVSARFADMSDGGIHPASEPKDGGPKHHFPNGAQITHISHQAEPIEPAPPRAVLAISPTKVVVKPAAEGPAPKANDHVKGAPKDERPPGCISHKEPKEPVKLGCHNIGPVPAHLPPKAPVYMSTGVMDPNETDPLPRLFPKAPSIAPIPEIIHNRAAIGAGEIGTVLGQRVQTSPTQLTSLSAAHPPPTGRN